MAHRLLALVRRTGDARPDADLLALVRDDPGAFAELVARHGPMVWGVCRHLLGEADAEDGFQATFVALLRSAPRNGAALAAWLHGAAVRIALTARRQAGRRRARERVAAAPESTPPREPDDWADTMAAVHREVAALPVADRAAFVLCVLEGQTQAEAAAHLGRTPGVVAGQVARAKKRLVARLAGRGIAPGLAALGTASAAGGVPPGLVGRVLGLPGAEVPPAVLRLSKGASGMTTPSTNMILAATVVAGLAAAVLAATADPPPGPAPVAGANQPAPADEPPAKGEDTPKPVRSLLGHTDRVTSVAYSPDGQSIATAAWDGTARIWDAQTGAEVRRLEFPATKGYNTFHHIAFSPDNAFVVTSVRESTDASVVIVWVRRTGENVRTLPAEAGSVAVSPDGKLIACGGYRLVRLYEFATGKLVRELRDEDEKQLRIESLAFTPDGRSLLTTGHPPTPQRGDGVTRLTIMPDVVRVWDVATGAERPSPLNGVVAARLGQHIALSPDGRTLLSPSGNDISLRETATGEERARLTGHKNEACDFAFLPDGRTLASGGMDGTVRLWDLPSGKELGRYGTEVEPFKGGWVLSVAFSPDGRALVSGGLDKAAHVWDVSRITGRPRASVERPAADLDADWKALAGAAAAGYAALGRLVSSPGSVVPFLRQRLEVAAKADTGPTERLIAALGDPQFQTREQAAKELEAMGDRAAPALRKAFAVSPSPEARRRLGQLLARVDGAAPSAETLREVRAVEALEAIGTPEARRAHQAIAAGPTGTRLTEEAKASADRLAGRR